MESDRVLLERRAASGSKSGCRGDVTIRADLTPDVDTLVDIDNDAAVLFENAGMHLDAATDREVTLAARDRWLKCLSAGRVLVAVDGSDQPLGFAAVGRRDGEPYLDQLSVRMKFMGRGIGTELLYSSLRLAAAAGGEALWLTTYDHLSWNRCYYQRHGFVTLTPEQCGQELQRELSFERRLLPLPEHRVAMRRMLRAGEFRGIAPGRRR